MLQSICLILCLALVLPLHAQTAGESEIAREAVSPRGNQKSKQARPTATPSRRKSAPRTKATPRPTPIATPTPSPTPNPFEDESTQSPIASPTPEPSPTPMPTGDIKVPPPAEVPPLPSSTIARLGKIATVNYHASLLSLPVPLKHGPSIGFIANENWTFELGYFAGSFGLGAVIVDLASFNEKLITATARYYPGKSFNWIFGVGWQAYDARLGSDIAGAISSDPSSIDLVRVQTLGLQLGFGNRWQWDNGFNFGVDWLTLNVPLATLSSESIALDYSGNSSVRGRIEDVLKFLRYIPTGAVARVNIGYAF